MLHSVEVRAEAGSTFLASRSIRAAVYFLADDRRYEAPGPHPHGGPDGKLSDNACFPLPAAALINFRSLLTWLTNEDVLERFLIIFLGPSEQHLRPALLPCDSTTRRNFPSC